MAGSLSQPLVRMSSASASRVPDVEGGPYTLIGDAGSAGLMSLHFLAVLGLPNGLAASAL